MNNSKGLPVSVYRDSLGDCTNGGISARASTVVLYGLEGFLDVPADGGTVSGRDPIALLMRDKEYLGGYRYAVPAIVKNGKVVPKPIPDGHVGWMNGGNLLATSDSRFSPIGPALPLHDRSEDYALYKRLSSD